MLNYLNNFVFDSYKEYVFSLLLLNVAIYMILLFNIFFIFFIFDIKYVKTLSELKFIGNIQSFSIFVVITLMSFAGVPPLLGFTGKFLIFITLLNKSSWIFLVFFSIINIFLIYFYIQNFRFLVAKRTYDKVFYKNNLLKSRKFVNILTFFNCINIFGIVYIEEVLIYFNFVASNMYI